MRNVEDIYPLSPLQQVFLVHALGSSGSGAGFEQSSCILCGELDAEVFQTAWQRIVDRHPVLRTAFVSDGLREPVQIVRQKVKLPFELQDWRDLGEASQKERMRAYLESDQRRGFAPSRAPLMRVGLFRLAEDRHFFVWSHHHLLLDGWCTALLHKELLAIYDALQRGEEPRLPPSRPFRDYISWLQRQDLAAAEAFWRRIFQGFSGPTPLVVDRLPRAGEPETGFGRSTVQLPLAATLEAQRLAERSGVTLSTLTLGLWALLLSRYSQRPDVVFGTTVSGRPADLPGVDTMVGMFINNLPVRTVIPSAASVSIWLRDFQALLLELRQYEHSSPAQIQVWSGARGVDRLFESLVVFQNYPTGVMSQELSTRRLKLEAYGSRLETNYPLTFLAAPGAALVFQLHFDRQRLDRATVARMLGHLQTLLASAAAAPDRTPDDLEMLTEAEVQQIVQGSGSGEGRIPWRPVWCFLEDLAARSPESVAVEEGSEKIRYGELARRVRELTWRLRGLGVERGAPVAVCLPCSPDLTVALLAVLRAGGVATLLDPADPWTVQWLSGSSARVLVSRQEVLTALGPEVAPEADRLVLDAESREPDPTSGAELPAETAPEQPACILHVLRDSGDREEITVSHRALEASLATLSDQLEMTSGDGVVARSPLVGSGVAVLELLLPLFSGARSLLVEPWSAAGRELTLPGAVVVHATPSEWCRLLAEGWEPRKGDRLLTGGEPLPRGLAVRLDALGAVLWSIYGAWEVGVWVAASHAPKALAETVGPVLAGNTMRLLDHHGRALPAGVPGEICLGGHCLPLTGGPSGERLLPDPLATESDDRLYRTGDIGRLLPDGRIELLGATTEMEEASRELAEIETVLRRVPEVLFAAVVSKETEPGRRAVYLVTDRDQPFGAAAVRRFLGGSLPGVAPPSDLVVLDRLPLAPDGRADRNMLRALEAPAGFEEAVVAPRTTLELQLVQIWERLVDRRPIGVTDSFFELGGHSLLAVRLVAEIRERFGREIPVAQLLQEPTIERLAQALEEKIRPPGPWSPLVPIQPSGVHLPLFCVHPAGGSALRYVSLAYRLGTDYPLYGLQARGHEKGQQPFDRVEEMAAFYCEAITSVRPHGPYLLGGWSFGGLVAFEMARQLLDRGEEVPLIALFDSAAGQVAWDRYTGPMPDRAERLARLLGGELPVSADELRQLESADEQVVHIIRQAQKRGLLPPDYELDQARRYLATLEAHGEALRTYSPRPFPGRVVQFCASEGLVAALGDPRLGWEELAFGGVEVHMIPGRHQDLFRPPAVQLVVERLKSSWGG